MGRFFLCFWGLPVVSTQQNYHKPDKTIEKYSYLSKKYSQLWTKDKTSLFYNWLFLINFNSRNSTAVGLALLHCIPLFSSFLPWFFWTSILSSIGCISSIVHSSLPYRTFSLSFLKFGSASSAWCCCKWQPSARSSTSEAQIFILLAHTSQKMSSKDGKASLLLS